MNVASDSARGVPALLLAGALLAVAACTGSLPVDQQPIGIVDAPGAALPSLSFEAPTVLQEGRLVLEMRGSIASYDLVFATIDGVESAPLAAVFSVRDATGRSLVASREVRDTLHLRPGERGRDHVLALSERFELAPGDYVAEVAVIGPADRPRDTRRLRVTLPMPRDAGMSAIRLDRDEAPLVGARFPRWRAGDEPVAAVDIVDHAQGEERVDWAILRIPADTAAALPPFWISPGRGSIAYRGARFDSPRADTAYTWSGSRQVFPLPSLQEGVYEIVARTPAGEGSTARPLVMLPPAWPRVTEIDEMIEALAYLAYPSELEQMRAGWSASERRRLFDAFWGALIVDRRAAEQTIRLYYERVEEANRRFTSHRPGWMTDAGMIYVVFGAPEVVERGPDAEVWHYAFGREDPSQTFVFERVAYDGAPWPLEHLVLQRAPRYELGWQREVRRWRSGLMR